LFQWFKRSKPFSDVSICASASGRALSLPYYKADATAKECPTTKAPGVQQLVDLR
jgi:hypothetical protein